MTPAPLGQGQPFGLVIFDCDGVLVDSERLAHQALCEVLAEAGVALSFDDAVARFIGVSLPRCHELIGELLGAPPTDAFKVQLVEHTKAAFSAHLSAVDGIAELLPTLKRPFCAASNGNRAKLDFTLGHTGLMPLLQGRVFCADDVARPKPAPDLFLHAAAAMGVAPALCVVVEDTPTGIAAARAAGMTALGYAAMTPAHRLREAGAHATFARMAELPALLAGGVARSTAVDRAGS
ncbi:HAD family phosphatase [Ideonella sp. A 288]|uniref:HAD family hydrolase n=1 Tax=Ideonella sp. A 288 TaxID=1962181 RepID=UPI0018FEB753|nr:HAD family phosphatase [Ideonella sp. A 288]